MGASIWAPGTALDANSSVSQESFTASAGQTLFTLTSFTYARSTNALAVYVGGLFQRVVTDFTETSQSSFTLTTPIVTAGTIVTAVGLTELTGGFEFVTEAQAAQTAAEAAAAAALVSQTASAVSAAASAASAVTAAGHETNAASSALAASNSAAEAAGYAAVGFNVASTIYDFGSVADAAPAFATDYGSIV